MTWSDRGRSPLIDSDSVLALCARQAAIDADCFHLLATEALRRRDIASYEAALAAYDSDLIREGGDTGGCDEPLSELRDQLALGLAEALERCGAEDHFSTTAPPRATPALPHPAPAAPAPAGIGRLIRLYGDNGLRARAARQRKGEPL